MIKELIKYWWFLVSILFFLVSYYWTYSCKIDAETYYYSKFYVSFRNVYEFLFSSLKFPLIYIWIIVLVFIIAFIIVRLFIQKKWSLWRSILFLTSIFLIHFSLFYILWGINYSRTSLIGRLNLKGEYNECKFYFELDSLKARLSALRSEIHEFPIVEEYNSSLKRELEPKVHFVFNEFNIGKALPLSCKFIHPKGFLFFWGASGVYWPFVGEAYVDAGLHPIQIPFTMAHEMSHVMGWTDEGECNLLAYLICKQSKDIVCQYSAEIALLRYMLFDLSTLDFSYYKLFRASLPNLIQNDLDEINKNINSYPEFLPWLRNYFYDIFLKSNGIIEGTRSYSNLPKWIVLMKENGMIED
jgi:hypothetical protein